MHDDRRVLDSMVARGASPHCVPQLSRNSCSLAPLGGISLAGTAAGPEAPAEEPGPTG